MITNIIIAIVFLIIGAFLGLVVASATYVSHKENDYERGYWDRYFEETRRKDLDKELKEIDKQIDDIKVQVDKDLTNPLYDYDKDELKDTPQSEHEKNDEKDDFKNKYIDKLEAGHADANNLKTTPVFTEDKEDDNG